MKDTQANAIAADNQLAESKSVELDADRASEAEEGEQSAPHKVLG